MRNVGLDVYRIMCMCMVYTTHFFWYGISGGGYSPKGFDRIIIYFLFCFSITAVNGFIVSSGFFSHYSNSSSKSVRIRKPIVLLIELVTIRLAFYFIKCIALRIETLSVKGTISALLPANYFTILFCTLFLLMPYINLMVNMLNTGDLRKLTLLSVLLFSIYPTMLDQYQIVSKGGTLPDLSTIARWDSNYGYTIVQFILMYIIGAYIRRITDENEDLFGLSKLNRILRNKRLLIIIYLINTIIIEIWSFIAIHCGVSIIQTSCEYCNPVNVLNTIIAFMFFKDLKIQISEFVIHKVAALSYMYFIIHVEILKILQSVIWTNDSLLRIILLWAGLFPVILIFVYFINKLYEKLVIPRLN